jgi:hypothetical protein
MNRSYSKIRHIKEANQKLENRLLNEQGFSGFGGGSSGGGGASGSWDSPSFEGFGGGDFGGGGASGSWADDKPAVNKVVNAISKVPLVTPKPKPKSQWTPCHGFPLRYGQYCKLIAQLQGAIGAMDSNKPADGYFGKKTEAALKIYYPEYQRSSGVSKEEFDKLMVPKGPLLKNKLNLDPAKYVNPDDAQKQKDVADALKNGQPLPGTTPSVTPTVTQTPVPQQEPQLSQQSQLAMAGKLTPQQIRQQARFDQRLARQARRTARRNGEQQQEQ